MAGQSLSVGFRPFPQTTPTRATAHERTPQQERQKAAREAERTLGQGMKKPVAGCYGRLTRWKGGGDVVYMALL
ncbi:TPA: hypothetical protein KKM80_005127 [Escherichia coli]|nr:hypothetical protein [Escherichia coli]HBD5990375.1 hypothetical protein [Escherichia coli]